MSGNLENSTGNQSWIFIGRTDAEAETPILGYLMTHWNRPWFSEGLGVGREGDDREWDGWMASLTRWTWVWVNSGSWWWTGRPGLLGFMGSQRVRHDWVTQLSWTELLGWKVITNLDSILKSRDITFPTKVNLVKAVVFSSSHVWMWELEYKERWMQKNYALSCGVGEHSWESLGLQEDPTSPSKREISPRYSLKSVMLMLKC